MNDSKTCKSRSDRPRPQPNLHLPFPQPPPALQSENSFPIYRNAAGVCTVVRVASKTNGCLEYDTLVGSYFQM